MYYRIEIPVLFRVTLGFWEILHLFHEFHYDQLIGN
jgi:hypothetical protein